MSKSLALLLLTPIAASQHVISGTAQNNWFGYSLAVDGDRVFAGAPRGYDLGFGAGRVNIYEPAGNHWQLAQGIAGPVQEPIECFGWSVDAHDEWLAVGATCGLQAGNEGAAYLYRQAGFWAAHAEVFPGDNVPDSQFGASVSIDADTLFVGAPDYEQPFAKGGTVWVYERSGLQWTLSQQIYNTFSGYDDRFGFAIDHEGDRLVVGAYSEQDATVPHHSGAVHVYEKVGGTWNHVQKITPTSPVLNGFFGRAVALDGERLVVGGDGQAELYEHDGTLFQPVALWAAPSHGYDVAINGNLAFAGTPAESEFESAVDDWTVRESISAPDSNLFFFGSALAAGDHWVAAGAYLTHPRGAIAIYPRDHLEPGIIEPFCPCPTQNCGTAAGGAGCVNSTGASGVLQWLGSPRVGRSDGALSATGLLVGSLSLIVMGTAEVSTPLGDGHLCVAGGPEGAFRFGPFVANSSGAYVQNAVVDTTHASFNSHGHIHAGDTWSFQAWYRDPQSTCGATSNLTNAVRVTFRP